MGIVFSKETSVLFAFVRDVVFKLYQRLVYWWSSAIRLSKQPDLRLRDAVVWGLFFPTRQVCCLHFSAMCFSNYTSALFTGDRLRLICQTCASVMPYEKKQIATDSCLGIVCSNEKSALFAFVRDVFFKLYQRLVYWWSSAINLSKQPDLRLRDAIWKETNRNRQLPGNCFFPTRQVYVLNLSAMCFSDYTSALFTGDRLRLVCLSKQARASVMLHEKKKFTTDSRLEIGFSNETIALFAFVRDVFSKLYQRLVFLWLPAIRTCDWTFATYDSAFATHELSAKTASRH